MRGYNEASNVISDSAGPSEFGTCANLPTTAEDQPVGGKIYYDSNRIQGVEMVYRGTTDTVLIGNKKSTYQYTTTVFNEEKGFIGFFGTQGTDRIY